MVLTERKRQILNNVIRDFIITGEPVGSSRLVKQYGLNVSPATVRNELAALEEMGYLRQPHTSAGRIPTDEGYRLYVSTLESFDVLSEKEMKVVSKFYSDLSKEIGDIMHETCDLLSNLTRYVALAFAPPLTKSSVKHLDLVWLGPNAILLVLITDTGRVVKRVIEIVEPVEHKEIEGIEKTLNQRLSGINIDEMSDELKGEIAAQAVPRNRDTVGLVISQIIDCLAEEEEERAYLGGTANILNYNQFDELNEIRQLMQVFEQKYFLLELLKEALDARQVVVKIGSENVRKEMQNCSFIGTSYQVRGKPVGTLGILGPRRMDYARVISAVKCTAQSLSEVLDSLHE